MELSISPVSTDVRVDSCYFSNVILFLFFRKTATVLIQGGTLTKNVYVVAGTSWAKVRTISDDRGRNITTALPSMAVEVTGWKSQPDAGELVVQVESEVKYPEKPVLYTFRCNNLELFTH